MAERTQFGSWEKLRSLGRGGQGEVFLVRKSSTNIAHLIDRIVNNVWFIGQTQSRKDKEEKAEELISVIRAISIESDAPHGALKVLHESAHNAASAKAEARMASEVEALKRFQHKSLVRIFDAKPSERWFVMEFFNGGTLHDHLERMQGDLLASLLAFRPLVHAVSELHNAGYIHRDIKPANIFIASDGHLVLGDFGLIINTGDGDLRVTDTYENVGSRDWMPGWAMGMRMDEVRATFDVFCLGKVLWSMLTGRPILRLCITTAPTSTWRRCFRRIAIFVG